MKSAWCAPEVQTLVPLTTKPPCTFTARVRVAARSEPLSGSDMPMQNIASPRAMRGRIACFCSSVPTRMTNGPDWRSAIQWWETGAPAASISSSTT